MSHIHRRVLLFFPFLFLSFCERDGGEKNPLGKAASSESVVLLSFRILFIFYTSSGVVSLPVTRQIVSDFWPLYSVCLCDLILFWGCECYKHTWILMCCKDVKNNGSQV